MLSFKTRLTADTLPAQRREQQRASRKARCVTEEASFLQMFDGLPNIAMGRCDPDCHLTVGRGIALLQGQIDQGVKDVLFEF